MQTSSSQRIVLPFGQQQSTVSPAPEQAPDLDQAGGKGASLVRIAASGLPVPPGFVLTTEAYRRFLAANDLGSVIADARQTPAEADPATWERVASTIQA